MSTSYLYEYQTIEELLELAAGQSALAGPQPAGGTGDARQQTTGQPAAGQQPAASQPAAGAAAGGVAAHPVSIGRTQVQSSDLAFITVSAEAARHLIMDLRDRFGFTHLVFLTAVDYIEEGKFLLTYMLHNYDKHMDIGVQVPIGRGGQENGEPEAGAAVQNNSAAEPAVMESIHDLWAQAGTYQRELKEMFGIDFPGSPRVDEAFILEGWDDLPPMRREFDTKQYSETTYFPRPGRSTNDPAEYMRRKLYPKE